jgi:hypothetical protein
MTGDARRRLPRGFSLLITPMALVTSLTALATAPDPGTGASPQPPAPAAPQRDTQRYTWDELVALVPDLANAQLEMSNATDESGSTIAVPKVCETVPEIGTRIARRKCYTLVQYIRKYCQNSHRGGLTKWCDELRR